MRSQVFGVFDKLAVVGCASGVAFALGNNRNLQESYKEYNSAATNSKQAVEAGKRFAGLCVANAAIGAPVVAVGLKLLKK